MLSAGAKNAARRRTVLVALLFTAISLLALVVRLRGVYREFWLDELVTAWVVRDGFGPLFQRAWIANLSPAFFLIVRSFVEVFGYTEAAMRAPSILAGVLLVPTTFFLAHRVCGNWFLAGTAGVLAAFDPTLIDYSLEARPYALIQLVGALQVCAFLSFTDCSPGNAGRSRIGVPLLFAVLTALGCWLQYTFLLMLAPEGLFLLLLVAAEKPLRLGRLGEFAGWLALSAVLCLPLLSHIGYLWSGRATLGSFVHGGGMDAAFTRFGAAAYVLLPLSFAWIAQCLSNGKGTAACENPSAGRLRRYSIFVLLWLLLPSLLVWATTRSGILRLDLDRYLAAAAVAPILIAVTLCPLFSSRTARVVFLVLIFASTPGVFLGRAIAGRLPAPQAAPAWQAAVAFVNRQCADSRPLFVRAGLVEGRWLDDRQDGLRKEYLLCPVHSLYVINRDSPRRTVEPIHGLALSPSQTERMIREGGFVLLAHLGSDENASDAGMRALRELGLEPAETKTVIRSYSQVVVLSVFLAEGFPRHRARTKSRKER